MNGVGRRALEILQLQQRRHDVKGSLEAPDEDVFGGPGHGEVVVTEESFQLVHLLGWFECVFPLFTKKQYGRFMSKV